MPGTRELDVIRWSADGKYLFASPGGEPGRILRIDVATGRREPWKTLSPQAAGVINAGWVLMTPDGQHYAYNYYRAATDDLYLVEGLR